MTILILGVKRSKSPSRGRPMLRVIMFDVTQLLRDALVDEGWETWKTVLHLSDDDHSATAYTVALL